MPQKQEVSFIKYSLQINQVFQTIYILNYYFSYFFQLPTQINYARLFNFNIKKEQKKKNNNKKTKKGKKNVIVCLAEEEC